MPSELKPMTPPRRYGAFTHYISCLLGTFYDAITRKLTASHLAGFWGTNADTFWT